MLQITGAQQYASIHFILPHLKLFEPEVQRTGEGSTKHVRYKAQSDRRVAILALLSQKPQIWPFLKAFGLRIFFWLFYHIKFEIWICPFCDLYLF